MKRNIERFPEHFMLQLTDTELIKLVTNCDRFSSLKHSSSLPYAFTEHGVTMLASVLKSDIAVQISIKIVDAFVAMRHALPNYNQLFTRIENIEHHQLLLMERQDKTENQIESIFQALADIKQIIEQAKKPTYVSINSFMIKSYWLVGRRIVEEKQGGKT